MSSRSRLRSWLVVLCLWSATGCSFALMKPPPRWSCTESRTLPWIDTVGSGVSAVLYTVLMVVSARTTCKPGETNCADFGAVAPGATVIFVPAVIGFGVSALYGHSWARRCRALHDDYRRQNLIGR